MLLLIGLGSGSIARSNPTDAPAAGDVRTALLPGGVEGIRRALDDRVPMQAAAIGVELTRRFYNGTTDAAGSKATLERLHTWLQACERSCGVAPEIRPDAVPLPGPPEWWRGVLGDPGVRLEHVVPAILRRRRAALLYTALLSMDDAARAWFIEQRALAANLSEEDSGALVVAAPFLRVVDGRWRLPGGPAADAVWSDLAGAPLDAAPAFLLALLRQHDGLLTYMLEVVATLSVDQQMAALALASGDRAPRLTAGRALLDGLKRTVRPWRPADRPFWRPSIDPALMLAQIHVGPQGRLALPGGRQFWEIALDDRDSLPTEEDVRRAWSDTEPVSPAWLVARLAASPAREQIIQYEQVLLASRWLADAPGSQAVAVMTAIRGYARFPQLLRVLERMGIDDVARVAAVVRQAEALSTAGSDARGRATLVRWQSALALLDRAVRSGALTAGQLTASIDALSAQLSPMPFGAWLQWLAPLLPAQVEQADIASQSLERVVIANLTTPAAEAVRQVSWESTTYRLDFGAAERDRIARVRGRDDKPRLDAAALLTAQARPDASAPATHRSASEALGVLRALVEAAGIRDGIDESSDLGRHVRQTLGAAHTKLTGDGAGAMSAASRDAIGALADAVATMALIELVYATTMGAAEDLPLSAYAASTRHIFVVRSGTGRGDRSWLPPAIVARRQSPWRVIGSVLGLDVALAPVALRRLSMRPLEGAPLLNTGDRSVLVSTAAVLDRRSFTDTAQQLLLDLVARARTRLAGVASPDDARRAARAAGMSTLRQNIAAWLATANRSAFEDYFSLGELVHLGLDGQPVPDSLSGWGNYELPLTGRLAAGNMPRLPWERFAGRSRRLLACAVPELQLRLALELAEMRLPASLVPTMMSSATLELVNTTRSIHTDDWHALVARVRAIDREAVERHLGLLTTAGPLRAEPARPSP